mgnify:CR=1 FL=1
MTKHRLPSKEELCVLLDYKPETGLLYWKHRASAPKEWNSRYAGQQAFTSDDGSGYRVGAINNKNTRAHRVIWKIMHDEEPEQIDHINGDRSDNRIENLRAVINADNGRNQKLRVSNSSGVMGVGFCKRAGKWRVRITINGKDKHLGIYKSYSEAVAARLTAEKLHGFHENHGRISQQEAGASLTSAR